MLINNLIPTTNPTAFSKDFLILLESHIPYLLARPKTTVIQLSRHQNDKFIGCFYDLLTSLNIRPQYHFIILRLNGYRSSSDFLGDRDFIVTPSNSDIDMLLNIFQTS